MQIWSSSSNLTQNICRKPSTEHPHSERTLPNSKMHPNNVSFSLISTLDPAYIREPKINKSTPFIPPKSHFPTTYATTIYIATALTSTTIFCMRFPHFFVTTYHARNVALTIWRPDGWLAFRVRHLELLKLKLKLAWKLKARRKIGGLAESNCGVSEKGNNPRKGMDLERL